MRPDYLRRYLRGRRSTRAKNDRHNYWWERDTHLLTHLVTVMCEGERVGRGTNCSLVPPPPPPPPSLLFRGAYGEGDDEATDREEEEKRNCCGRQAHAPRPDVPKKKGAAPRCGSGRGRLLEKR